jgi:hypothetical protein
MIENLAFAGGADGVDPGSLSPSMASSIGGDTMSVERDAKIRSWFSSLLESWQRAWDAADPKVRSGVEASLCHLAQPLKATLYVSRSHVPPLEASVLILSHVEHAGHSELAIRLQEDGSEWTGDAPECCWAQEIATEIHRNILSNWTPHRSIPILSYRGLNYERLESEVFHAAWTIPGDLTTIEVEKFIEAAFRPRLEAVPPPRQPDPRPQIAALQSTREPIGLSRWLTMWAPALSAALGVQGPSWCGLFLPRADVLDATLNGDIDFITGSLELELDSDEWERRVRIESEQMPIWAPHQSAISRAMMRAADDGLIRWPPRLDDLAACEVKVSWFEPETNTWHATHKGEARREKGKLRLLRRFGFNRIGFFHLGATKPRSIDSVNPWILAGSYASLASRSFELLYSPAEAPDCGYFQAVVGSVPFAAEDSSGAGGPLRIHQTATALVFEPSMNRWQRLAAQLSQLPRPRSCRVCVRACSQCKVWSLVNSPSLADCGECGRRLYDDPCVPDLPRLML